MAKSWGPHSWGSDLVIGRHTVFPPLSRDVGESLFPHVRIDRFGSCSVGCFLTASQVNHMTEIQQPEKPKITRSVRLDPELDDQLVLVCKTLGVNPNAYLRQVVGEAINKHLSQYRIEQGLIQAVNAQMAKIFEMMAEQEGKQDAQ